LVLLISRILIRGLLIIQIKIQLLIKL
jgi:hypothetical protein